MIKEMNKKIFLRNLQETIKEMNLPESIDFNKYKFRINPIIEKGKSMDARDEIMRLDIINPNRVNGKTYTMEDVVTMLTLFSPLVPIWINCKLLRYNEEEAEIQLDCSLRLRKPSLLRNQESGHPPFKTIV